VNREELEQAIQKASQETIDGDLMTYSEKHKHRKGQAVINTRSSNMFPVLLFKLTATDGSVSWHVNRNGLNHDIVDSAMEPKVYAHYVAMLEREHEEGRENFRAGNFAWYLSQAGYKRELFSNPWEAGITGPLLDYVEKELSEVPIYSTAKGHSPYPKP
jgi:hypothetical protein